MFASIRQYRVDPNRSEELIQLIEEQLVPLIDEIPGFVTYYLVCTQEGTLASLAIYRDHEGMKESDKVAQEWVEGNLEKLLAFYPKNISAAFSTIEGYLRGRGPETSENPGDSHLKGASQTRPPENQGRNDGRTQLLTVEDVCEELGMGRSWVYRRIRSGEIPSIRLGRALKVKQADLVEYVENQRWRPSDE